MPLFHAVGVTCRDKTYDIAFGFMAGEDHIHYNWQIQSLMELFERLQVQPKMFITDYDTALKTALTSIYPNHAVKVWDTRYGLTAEEKVEIDRKRGEFMARWHRLVSQLTQALFWSEWAQLEVDYRAYPALIKYLLDQQIKYHDQWAEYKCRYLPDFGIRVTSRVESAYHRLKSRLVYRSKSHIIHVVKEIHKMMLEQRNDHDAGVSFESIRYPVDASSECLVLLYRKVSYYALRKLKQQVDLAFAEDYLCTPSCLNAFTLKFGLPYSKSFTLTNTGGSSRRGQGASSRTLLKTNFDPWIRWL
ncbi:hypothetical protein PTT_16043 [Pyrenophora teres f. teres 0-1]|uniref:MULE transposase domain-containing protein n=1 Tax=Pyrenophora teres f. teres (strain 0-1) TaxID=861557 RepID=E3S1G1_PYRTT|nr:hypothetical protein PTT_16043 [Pyrenophora teres f. teres 0-1]